MKIYLKEETPSLTLEDRVDKIITMSETIYPDGISTSLIEAEGDLIIGLSAGVGLRLPAPTVSGLSLISNMAVSGLWELGTPETGGTVTMTNKSGSDLAAGTIVIFYAGSDKAFTTTAEEGSRRVCGVLAEAIDNESSGQVAIIGRIQTVLVQGNVARGEWIKTSTTAGRGVASGYTKADGDVALALTAYSGGGAGTVEALVMTDVYKARETFTKRVLAGADDGYVDTNGGVLYAATTMVYFGNYDGTITVDSYLRFTGINIPQGAKIISAKLTFKAYDAQSGTVCAVKVKGNAADDAIAPTTYAEYTGMARTTAQVAWTVPAVANDEVYDSEDITAIVQEIVNRAGWAYGNAMQFFVENDGSDASAYRTADSYDGAPADAPLLTIEW